MATGASYQINGKIYRAYVYSVLTYGDEICRARIVKNELGVSNTAGTKRFGGHNGMNRGTGGLNPPTPVNWNHGNMGNEG